MVKFSRRKFLKFRVLVRSMFMHHCCPNIAALRRYSTVCSMAMKRPVSLLCIWMKAWIPVISFYNAVLIFLLIGSLINYLRTYLHSVQKPCKRSWLTRLQRLVILHSKHTIGPHIPGKLLKNGDESTGVKMRTPFII